MSAPAKPTHAQAEAGNYRKRHLRAHGLDISIENDKGSKRSGVGKDGKPWSVTMPAHYGYIRRTKGADGDHVDVYVGPHPHHPHVHLVDQVDADTGKFDEHKAMLGFRTKADALATYKSGFSDGKGGQRIGKATTIPMGTFKEWVTSGTRSKPYAMAVDRTHDNPELAGESEDQKCLYLDKHIPKRMTVKGKSFDPAKYLAIHEAVERSHTDKGMKYQPAHRLALVAERRAVEADGIDWDAYQEQFHKLAQITDKEPASAAPTAMHREYAEGGLVRSFEDGALVDEEDGPWNDAGEGGEEKGPWNDDTAGEEEHGPWEEEPLTTKETLEQGAARVGKAVVPGLGALPAAALGLKGGAALGTLVAGPPGTAVGGFLGAVGGGLLGGAAVREIEEWVLNKLGLNVDPEKEQQFQREHPNVATGLDIAGGMAGMSPARGAVTLGQRITMGGVQGGLEGASELVHGEGFDPVNLGMAFAAGAALPGLNKAGQPLWNLGERAAARVGLGVGRPGRPDLKALPKPADFTVSPEGEATRNLGNEGEVFNDAEAPRGGTAAEAERPIYEMNSDEYTRMAPGEEDAINGRETEGVAPDENVAAAADTIDAATNKTAESIAQDKREAGPARNMGGSLGNAFEQARPEKRPEGVGSNPDHPLSVGSERNGLKEALKTEAPTAEILEPESGNIPEDIRRALGQEPAEPVTGAVKPEQSDTGIVEAAAADTADRYRKLGIDKVADAIEKDPSIAPRAREILRDLTQQDITGAPIDAEKASRARRILESAQTAGEKKAGKALLEEAQNPFAGEQRQAKEAVEAQNRLLAREKGGQTVEVGGQKITASTERKANLLKRAADAAQSAYEKFAPESPEVNTSIEARRALQGRLAAALDHATEENLGKALSTRSSPKETPAQRWLREARQLLRSTRGDLTAKQALEFQTNERLLRSGAAKEVKETSRIAGDIANKRVAPEAAEKNATEAWKDALSPKDKQLFEEQGGGEALPIEALENHAQESTLFDHMERADHEMHMDEDTGLNVPPRPREKSEELPKKNVASKVNEVGAIHSKAEEEALDRAIQAVQARTSKLSLKDPAKNPSLKELASEFLKGTSGNLKIDDAKVRAALTAGQARIKDWVVRNLMPEMFSEKARIAEPRYAEMHVKRAGINDHIRDALDAEWHMFDKLSEYDKVSFMTRFEAAKPHPEDWMNAADARIREMLDNAYRSEKVWGSKAEYVENYLSHLFENDEAYTKFRADQIQRHGPTWFQKERGFSNINDALRAGMKLKYTNPMDIVTRRLMASAHMQLTMELLHEMNAMGLAHPVKEAPENLKGTWQQIGAPNQSTWMIAPDIQALWKNGVDSKGLWANEGAVGSAFRGWMKLKSIWAPIKLSLSAFHPLHIALGVLQADNFARGWAEGGLGGGLKEMGKNMMDPLFAIGAGKSWGNFKPDFIGKQVREAVATPWEVKTPWQEEVSRWRQEGGFRGTMSPEEVANYKREFLSAWRNNNWLGIGKNGFLHAMEKISEPVFQNWIPNLKEASFYRSASAYFKAHPEAVNNPDMRRIALREIAKSVDNRYGEMFYGGVFWNRYAKDASIGSFLSLGWNLGFAREFGGAAIKAGRTAAAPLAGPRTGAAAIAHDAGSRGAYVMSYIAITSLIAGGMGYALSGQMPNSVMDYIFPKAGGVNPDGSPRRLSTMFYTREPMQAKAHIEERNSWAGGLGQMLYNKMVFAPVVQAFQNRDFFGRQLYDPDAPWLKQWGQLAKSVLGDAFNPIALSSMERAEKTGGGARDKALAVAGFGPAPGYVSKDALQNRISHLFYEGPGGGVKPYATKERDQQRSDDLAAVRRGGPDAVEARSRLFKSGVTPATLIKELHETTDKYQFSRLDKATQLGLVKQMDDKQFLKYLPSSGKARYELVNEWRRLHPGRNLPSR